MSLSVPSAENETWERGSELLVETCSEFQAASCLLDPSLDGYGRSAPGCLSFGVWFPGSYSSWSSWRGRFLSVCPPRPPRGSFPQRVFAKEKELESSVLRASVRCRRRRAQALATAKENPPVSAREGPAQLKWSTSGSAQPGEPPLLYRASNWAPHSLPCWPS